MTKIVIFLQYSVLNYLISTANGLGLTWEKESLIRKPLTVMPELAAISTSNDTIKNPLQVSPPGKENIKSMFLFLKHHDAMSHMKKKKKKKMQHGSKKMF